MLILISIFELIRIQKNHSFQQKEEIIVFNQYKNSVLGIRYGQNLDVFILNEMDSAKINQYLIEPYKINEGIKEINYFKMDDEWTSNYIKSKNVLYWNGHKILIVNRNLNLNKNDFDYILVQNSSKINLDSIPEKTQVILDGSNYPNHLNDFENRIWRTRNEGAKRITASQ